MQVATRLYAPMDSRPSDGKPKRFWGRGGAGRTICYGGLAGAIEMTVNMPFEYIKTYVQLYPERARTMADVVRLTRQQYGLLGLYRGLAPMLAFSVPKSAVRFGVVETMRGYLRAADGTVSLSMNALAGLCGGIAEAILVVTPQETMKVRLIHDRLRDNPRFKSSMHGVRSIIAEEGLGGVYKGLTATILKQGTNQMIRFATFYYIKTWMLGSPKKDFDHYSWTGFAQITFAGLAAGTASVIANTPLDVVKTKMQGLEAQKYKGFSDCIASVYRESGLIGFYKGVVPRLMRVSLDVAIVMSSFTYIQKFIDDLIG